MKLPLLTFHLILCLGSLAQTNNQFIDLPSEEFFDNDYCCTTPPEYPGGETALLESISKNINKQFFHHMTLQGTVYVSFTVDTLGFVTDVKVVRGLQSDFDKEAIRVVSMLERWKPAENCGKHVPVQLTLPIRFQLN